MTDKRNSQNQQVPQFDSAARTGAGRIGSSGDAGWVGVDELLKAVNSHGVSITLDDLKHIVATSDKKRFAFSENGRRIRASQGHSVEVDLQYPTQTPPELLYHGTATRFLDAIRQHGVQKMAAPRCSLVGGDEGHAPGRWSPRQTDVVDDSRGRHVPGRIRIPLLGQWRLAGGIMCRLSSSSFRPRECAHR